MGNGTLTAKQRAFVFAYTNTVDKTMFNNGLQSARYAGYKGGNKQLATIAGQNLSKLDIKAEIARIDAKRVKKVEHTRTNAINMLLLDFDALEVKAAKGDILAIRARTAIVSELNGISNLKVQTIKGGYEEPEALTEHKRAELVIMTAIRLKEIGRDE